MSRQIQRYVLRVSQILYGRVVSAAKREDLSMNEWITQVITEKLDGPMPPLPSTQPAPSAKPKAQELAARFGITTAAQLDEASAKGAILQAQPQHFDVGNCPVEDVVPKRDWRKFYLEMQEMEPSEAFHEFHKATEGIKLPFGFLKMPANKQLAWLQLNG